MLVLVCGPPGVGKSTAAREAADRLDARLLRSDVVRADLFPDPTHDEAEREAVYDELIDRATAALETGGSVVLDATFAARAWRSDAVDAADQAGVEARILRVTCDPAVVERRIAARSDDASDADAAAYREVRERFDPLAVPHATVDNSGDLAALGGKVARALGAADPAR